MGKYIFKQQDRKISGAVAGIEANRLVGWAIDELLVGDAIIVDLYVDGMRLATTTANQYSKLVEDINYAVRLQCFSFDLSSDVFSCQSAQRLSIRSAREEIQIGQSIALRDLQLTPDFKNSPPDQISGHVDSVVGGYISGWAYAADRPTESLFLRLVENGVTIDAFAANNYREDLYAAHLGDGCHGFHHKLPARLFDGDKHHIRLVENLTDKLLVNGGMDVGVFVTPELGEEIVRIDSILNELKARLAALETRNAILEGEI